MASDGLHVSGDVTATTTGSVAVSYLLAGTSGYVNLRPLYFQIYSGSSNSADVCIDVSGNAAVATTSASFHLRPGKTFPPILHPLSVSAGYSGFAIIATSGSQWVYWSAWR